MQKNVGSGLANRNAGTSTNTYWIWIDPTLSRSNETRYTHLPTVGDLITLSSPVMAGPSTIAENDFVVALRLQLSEAGAGDVSIRNLLDLPQLANPESAVQRDSAFACELTSAESALGRDSKLAHTLAAVDAGHAPSVPNRQHTDVAPVSQSLPPVLCPICMELCSAAMRFSAKVCGHVFCTLCMRQHLSLIATETRQYPVQCPTCRAELDPQDCLEALAGSGEVYSAFEQFILERRDHSCIRYCSNIKCSIPFDWDDDPSLRQYLDRFKVECPLCKHATCVQCKVAWHDGQTCEQYISEKKVQDEFEWLAQQNEWKDCPRCGQVIDRRQGDCNFVKCRCGCGFCHRCGKEYVSLVATAQNSHGRPDCTCGLFTAHPDPQAAPQNQAGPAFRAQEAQVLPRNPAAPAPEELIAAPHPPLHHIPEMPLNVRFDDIRDEFDSPIVYGPNGYISLMSWLHGVRRRRLPPAIEEAVREHSCPYAECQGSYHSMRALEQHLVNVRRHPVFLCCGRPFASEQCIWQHRASVHNRD